MKKLFLVGAKLMGIHLMFTGIMSLFALATTGNPPMPNGAEVPAAFQVTKWLVGLLPITLGFALTFFTAELGKIVGTTELSQELEGSPGAFLRVGIILIGMEFLIPTSSRFLGKLLFSLSSESASSAYKLGIADFVPSIIGLVLIFRAGPIADFMERVNRAG